MKFNEKVGYRVALVSSTNKTINKVDFVGSDIMFASVDSAHEHINFLVNEYDFSSSDLFVETILRKFVVESFRVRAYDALRETFIENNLNRVTQIVASMIIFAVSLFVFYTKSYGFELNMPESVFMFALAVFGIVSIHNFLDVLHNFSAGVEAEQILEVVVL